MCAFFWVIPRREFYMPTFRNTLFHLHRSVGMKYDLHTYRPAYADGVDRVFRNVGI